MINSEAENSLGTTRERTRGVYSYNDFSAIVMLMWIFIRQLVIVKKSNVRRNTTNEKKKAKSEEKQRSGRVGSTSIYYSGVLFDGCNKKFIYDLFKLRV